MEEADKLLGAGKKHLVMGKVVEAVSTLQEACGMLAKKYGDTADECGEAFFWCGKALLDLARMENSVLGNALEGVPEEEEDGDKPQDSNVESAENVDEKTRDELRVQVYDAMAEKKSEDGEKGKDAEAGGEQQEAGKDSKDSGSKPSESGDEDKDKVTEEEPAAKEKDSEPAAEEVKEADLAAEAEQSSALEKEEEPAAKEEKDSADKKDDSTTKEEEAADKKGDEPAAKEEEEDSAKEEPAAKEEEEDSAKEEEPAAEGKKDSAADDNDSAIEEGEDGEEEDGEDAEMECDTEEQAGGDDTGDKDSEEEEEEEVGNLQLAWEMLELAKVIYKRNDAKEEQLMAAQAHLKLGEVSVESGNYEQALEDFQECLKLQVKHLDPDSRLLAETHYQLGLTYSLNAQYSRAVESLSSSISVIKSRLDKLQEMIDKAEGPEALLEEKKEMEELKALLPEIQEKVEDATESLKTDGASTSSAFPGSTVQNGGCSSGSEVKGTPAAGASSDENASTAPVSDISHLVRKKRKPEESPVKEGVKKVKQDDGQADEAPLANGQAKTMEVESM